MDRPRKIPCFAAAALAAMLGVAPAPEARATIEALDGLAHVRLPATGGSGVVTAGPFSVFAWVRPALVGGVERSALRVSGALELGLDAQGRPLARLRRASGAPSALEAVAPTAIEADEWALLAASFDPATGALWVGGVSESAALSVGEASAPGFAPGPVSGDTFVGAAGSTPGMAGAMGLVVIRRELALAGDAQAVWDSRWFHASYELVTTGSGGLLSGAGNAWWMVNHSVSTLPANGLSVASSQGDRAGVIGAPVTSRNFAIYDRSSVFAPMDFAMVRPVAGVDSCLYVSHHEGENAGFFVRRLPEGGGSAEARVSAVAPRARRLATEPAGPWKVMISGNSRAAKRFDGSGVSPGNYAHGFALRDEARTSGVLNAPVSTSKTPWFGLDTAVNASYSSGEVATIGQSDYSRFWTGSVTNGGVGPGGGLLLSPGAEFSLRCRPQGLIRADAPLVVRAHVLACPGASAVKWAPNKFTRQGAFGEDVAPEQTIALDTTTGAVVMSAGDSYAPDGTLTLAGDRRDLAAAGHALVVGDSISVIRGADFGLTTPGATTILLEHPLGAAPGPGDTALFGPWRFEMIEFVWSALAPNDPDVWRGLRLEAAAGGAGFVLFGMDAWRPDVDGYVWGVSGWGGNGYQPQIDESFGAALEAWMRVFSPDVWLTTFAQQFSSPSSMATWADLVRAALPHADVVWLGDMAHASTFTPWHDYIIENGAAMGTPAVSLLMHPELGEQNELFADGLRADGNHISQRGNEQLAALWLDALVECALGPSLPGDADGDGAVGFGDLNIVLSEYNATGQGLAGDLDFDNRVDFADLNLVLDGFGQTAPPR